MEQEHERDLHESREDGPQPPEDAAASRQTGQPARAAGSAAGPARERAEPAKEGPNLRFYRNQQRSQPDGAFIEDMHAKWSTDFGKLERHHSYIQWCFPVMENGGMNRKASALTRQEARVMQRDEEVGRRVIASYRMMLAFYGLDLVDERTGKLGTPQAPPQCLRAPERRFSALRPRPRPHIRSCTPGTPVLHRAEQLKLMTRAQASARTGGRALTT